MNSWDDPGFRKAIEATGRKNILMTGLWTEVCITWPTIEMLGAGYNIYVVEDCCGATSPAAQEAALSRMVRPVAVRLTTIGALLEWQRDWKTKSTTTRSWDFSNNKAALTASAWNTLTRWFITRRNPHRSPKLCEEGGRRRSRHRLAVSRLAATNGASLSRKHGVGQGFPACRFTGCSSLVSRRATGKSPQTGRQECLPYEGSSELLKTND